MLVTSELLQKLAPSTAKAKRDRFLPYLQEACSRYGIDTELRVAAFLATCCFESDYFRTTQEYRARSGRAKTLQDRYWSTNFYGRGLIQLTHKENYEAFAEHLKNRIIENTVTDGSRAKVYPNPVAMPEEVAQPELAVISACWYWQSNNLNRYADKGQFFAIQGLVNKGNAKKEALDYPTREKLYSTALRAIPDQDSAAAILTSPVIDQPGDASLPVSLVDTANSASTPQITFLDRVSSPFIKAREKWQALNVDPASISGSSWFTIVKTQGLGYVTAFAGWLYSNPLYVVIGVVLVILGVWFFSRSKDRLDARMAGIAPVNTNTLNVEVAKN